MIQIVVMLEMNKIKIVNKKYKLLYCLLCIATIPHRSDWLDIVIKYTFGMKSPLKNE